jgi:murein DD-endopeptidase MepM/ murein hydrolase activator NlpD
MSAVGLAILAASGVAVLGGGAAAASMQVVDSTAGTPDGLVWPVAGAVITQGFGCTAFLAEPADAQCPQGHIHLGLDFGAPLGTAVVAAAGGVAHVVDEATGLGLHVTVGDGAGLLTVYGHLSHVLVTEGEYVGAGIPVGEVGSTGNSTGPHLHFEVRRDGLAEDPVLDLAPP